MNEAESKLVVLRDKLQQQIASEQTNTTHQNYKINRLTDEINKLQQFIESSKTEYLTISDELDKCKQLCDNREQNISKITSERNSALIKLSSYKRQLEEERQFIYLEWIISRTKHKCALVYIRSSVQSEFTNALIITLKQQMFAKQRKHADILQFLQRYQFSIIKTTTIGFKTSRACDCFDAHDSLIRELFRTTVSN